MMTTPALELVPLPLYRPRHRGIPRECTACGRWETEHSEAMRFFDGTGTRPQPAPTVVRGRHKARAETLVGP